MYSSSKLQNKDWLSSIKWLITGTVLSSILWLIKLLIRELRVATNSTNLRPRKATLKIADLSKVKTLKIDSLAKNDNLGLTLYNSLTFEETLI